MFNSPSIFNCIINKDNFAELVTKFSEDPGSKETGGLYEDFLEADMVPEFSSFCATEPIGKIGIVKTNFGFHIIEVLERASAKFPLLVSVTKTFKASDETLLNKESEVSSILYKLDRSITKVTSSLQKNTLFDKIVTASKYTTRSVIIEDNNPKVTGLTTSIAVNKILELAFTEEAAIGDLTSYPIKDKDKYIIAMISSIKEKGEPMVKFMDSLAHAMLKLTNMIMWLAPLAVFSSISVVIADKGIGVLKDYSKLIAMFYGGLSLLWVILIGLCYIMIRKKTWSLLSHIKEPLMLAFATASSESAYPKLLNQLDRFGIKEKISSFVLPLGYSFNLDGSMMYMTFGSLLIAQAYGIDLSIGQQITMLLVLMITSKGIAGVPRASLVVIAATVAGFGIPEAGLALLLPIDQFLDMGRTATNVVGNAVATVAVSKMEGEEINH